MRNQDQHDRKKHMLSSYKGMLNSIRHMLNYKTITEKLAQNQGHIHLINLIQNTVNSSFECCHMFVLY